MTSPPALSAVHNVFSIGEAYQYHSIHLLSNGQSPVKKPISGGGYSDIYLGRAEIHGQVTDVAVKVIRIALLHGQPQPIKTLTRLLRETLVWKGLDHRNVVDFYGLDFSSVDAQQLIALEKSGQTSGVGRLEVPGLVSTYLAHDILNYVLNYPNLRSQCIIDVARGLTYLHHKGVIHGDLRPDNIRVDRDGTVKILDFGLSKLFQISGFTTQLDTLSPRWVAPEVVLGEEERPTFQADVYAFSMCMLQLLAHLGYPDSSRPFNHITAPETASFVYLDTICTKKGRPIRTNYPNNITDTQWDIMTMCWDHDAEKRPTIHEVFENLNGRSCRDSSKGACWL